MKHIILWKLKEEFNNEKIKSEMKEALEGLVGKIDGLTELKVYTKVLDTSNVDVMLYSELESFEAYQGYRDNPFHVHVADTYVRPFVETRACIDYED